jgi:hypothetical protein
MVIGYLKAFLIYARFDLAVVRIKDRSFWSTAIKLELSVNTVIVCYKCSGAMQFRIVLDCIAPDKIIVY